ncbi:electron transfer flavoprotein subunit [Enterobacterales bacterium]|nr:electron transfer flavoprotein subunit [Enterobacterales bacterium]
MNITLILDMRLRAFLSQAQDLNDFLIANQLTDGTAELWLFYAGGKPDALPKMVCNLRRVVWISLASPGLAEQQLEALVQGFPQYPSDLLLFASDELATRLACRLRGVSSTGVTHAAREEQHWRVEHPAYGNRVQVRLELAGFPLCISVAASGSQPAQTAHFTGVQETLSPVFAAPEWLVKIEQEPLEVDDGLRNASYILAVGQGAGSVENLRALEIIAAKLGAEVGVSRPVAMNAWCGMSRMLGVSGVIAAPKVCIVAGASGAAALMAGLDHSEFIVAVNTDPQAAIFAQADVGIVGDLHETLEALSHYLTRT